MLIYYNCFSKKEMLEKSALMTKNNGYPHQTALLVKYILTVEEKALVLVKKTQFRENMRTYPPGNYLLLL